MSKREESLIDAFIEAANVDLSASEPSPGAALTAEDIAVYADDAKERAKRQALAVQRVAEEIGPIGVAETITA